MKVGCKLSIRKRLILSNIAMIIIPIITFILLQIILDIFFFSSFDPTDIGHRSHAFYFFRFGIIIPIFAITNALLSYFVSRSIIKPIKGLNDAAKKIREGNLDFQIKPDRNDEIGQLAQSFELMRHSLKESSEIQKKYEQNRKELIANISHDLKTPMTSIKGYVEGIRDGIANTPDKMERYIHTIHSKTIHMDHLIDELFLYSKLDLKRVPFYFEEVNIHHYLLDRIEELQFDLDSIHVMITYENVSKQTNNNVVMAREQFKRVFTNIIQNSLKYMDKSQKKISIKLMEENEKVIIEFKDNGKGISKDVLPNIFDQFYRVDQSRNTMSGGSGLGLAIVKRIIEEHGGQVWANSEEGENTSIYITLNKVTGMKEII